VTSIIVLHYGDRSHTDACLTSIACTTPDAEVVVVDNQGDFPDAQVRPGRNLGFAQGCNAGAMHADGEKLVFLNNDCLVHPGWLWPLSYHLDDPGIGIVGARLIYPDGVVQHAGVRVDFTRPPGEEAWNIDRGLPVSHQNIHKDVDAISGACLAIRADTFDELNGFDPGFRNGYEDVDLALRAREAGYRVVYEPASLVTHLESASGPERFRHVQHNVARLRSRWAGRTV